ncbi:ABC transporter ATP-binding protein [Demequina mangrovi]|uniref:ATP-binding cassette, subfamily B n=1 Tax=Demequina mangrovi TaxID=1043493 RepID=A0A1H6XZZ7_9MICO|nr:ABC transporter ATP-binding protein [Demequina mangrovi]SEJ33214.1 ATP-binding cassette, subfamily B [Demequina mangrovi]
MRELVTGIARLAAVAYRARPARFVLVITLAIVRAISGPGAAIAAGAATDAAVAGDGTRAAWAGALLVASGVTYAVLGQINFLMGLDLSRSVFERLQRDVIEATNGSDGIAHHERPDYADRLRVLTTDLEFFQYFAMEHVFSSVRVVVGGAVALAALTAVSPWLLLLPLAGALPVWAGRRAESVMGRARERAAQDARRATHLLGLATAPGPAKEIRLTRMGARIRELHASSYRRASSTVVRGELASGTLQGLALLLFGAAFIGSALFVVRSAVAGDASVGDVVLVITLASQIVAQLAEAQFLANSLQRIAAFMERLEWARSLVASRAIEAPLAAPESLADGIRFTDVRFTYPGTDAPVLDGVDLHLPAGGVVAIVGENGAGKSTLVKLLCRFYEPTHGVVRVDGTDLARIPVPEWRSRLTAGFQDFCRLETTARHTVGLGDLDRRDDDDAVLAALERAASTVILDRLPDGLDTHVGKSYTEGTELSGGQWQKLALGRAMMRDAPLVMLLDEPTSALDAEAEHRLFERYAASASRVARTTGAITVLVSHRFSTVRMADLILVVDDGRIREAGSHEELMEVPGGLYAELFALQAAQYS